jgi:predicted amidohydrolase
MLWMEVGMTDVTVAAVCFRSSFGDVGGNLRRIRAWASRLSSMGVGIACFPELSVTGYDRTEAIRALCQHIPGPVTDQLVEIALELNIALLVGMPEVDDEGHRFISQVLVSDNGLEGTYRKTHLGPVERDEFTAGDRIPVFSVKGCKIGIQICYDSHFPEVAASQALNGAEVLFIPFSCPFYKPQTMRHHLMRYLPARAYDNGCYVVACNHVGCDRCGQSFAGVALIIGPRGDVIKEVVGAGEDAAVALLDGGEVDRIRGAGAGHFLTRRRPELYYSLHSQQWTGNIQVPLP